MCLKKHVRHVSFKKRKKKLLGLFWAQHAWARAGPKKKFGHGTTHSLGGLCRIGPWALMSFGLMGRAVPCRAIFTMIRFVLSARSKSGS